jgi:hypothetical protein
MAGVANLHPAQLNHLTAAILGTVRFFSLDDASG